MPRRRIGCLFIPDFHVAVQLIHEPSLGGCPFVVTGCGGDAGGGARSDVLEASPLAVTAGVEPRMTLVQARAACRDLQVRGEDRERLAATEKLLLKDLQQRSPAFEVIRPGLVLFEASGLGRHYSAGEDGLLQAVVADAREMGFSDARVGSASNRFTAQVAARSIEPNRDEHDAECGWLRVPTGRERRFLARQPIGVLPLTDDEYFAFRALGLRRLGDIAVLPKEALEARYGARGLFLWRLSCGRDLAVLQLGPRGGQVPTFEISWDEAPPQHAEAVIAAVAERLGPLLEELWERRGLACASARVRLRMDHGRGEKELVLRPEQATTGPALLLAALRRQLAAAMLAGPPVGVCVELDELEPLSGEPLELFAAASRRQADDVAALVRLLERLGRAVGVERVVRYGLVDAQRPERRFEAVSALEWAPTSRSPTAEVADPGQPGVAFRMFQPARVVEVQEDHGGRPVAIGLGSWGSSSEAGADLEPIEAATGPERLSGEWWAGGFARDYHDVLTRTGAIYRVFRDVRRGAWYLEGVYD